MRLRRCLRLAAVGYGVAFFLWLSIEDNAIWPAVLFGLGLATLLLFFTFLDKLEGNIVPVAVLPLFGILIGMGTAVTAAALMFFKNAVHAHIFWDYPPGLVFAILQRALVWAAAGGLAGLCVALGWLWLKSSKHDRRNKQQPHEVAEDAA